MATFCRPTIFGISSDKCQYELLSIYNLLEQASTVDMTSKYMVWLSERAALRKA
jgi:hypothetical protein